MTKIFYQLEDHFAAVAECHPGTFAGWASRTLRVLFGFAGDLVRTRADGRGLPRDADLAR